MTRITAAAGLTVPLLVRRFLADYARNPVNLLMLVLVPMTFVAAAAAGSLSQLARLLSGTMAPGAAMQTVTAGWAAAFIAAIAAYFQVRAARSADRRLVLAGLPAGQLAAARAVTGLALAVVASAAAVVTLTVLKVFLIDMRGLTGIYQALSFMGLGVVLLGIGWLYQRLLFPPGRGATYSTGGASG